MGAENYEKKIDAPNEVFGDSWLKLKKAHFDSSVDEGDVKDAKQKESEIKIMENQFSNIIDKANNFDDIFSISNKENFWKNFITQDPDAQEKFAMDYLIIEKPNKIKSIVKGLIGKILPERIKNSNYDYDNIEKNTAKRMSFVFSAYPNAVDLINNLYKESSNKKYDSDSIASKIAYFKPILTDYLVHLKTGQISYSFDNFKDKQQSSNSFFSLQNEILEKNTQPESLLAILPKEKKLDNNSYVQIKKIEQDERAREIEEANALIA